MTKWDNRRTRAHIVTCDTCQGLLVIDPPSEDAIRFCNKGENTWGRGPEAIIDAHMKLQHPKAEYDYYGPWKQDTWRDKNIKVVTRKFTKAFTNISR